MRNQGAQLIRGKKWKAGILHQRQRRAVRHLIHLEQAKELNRGHDLPYDFRESDWHYALDYWSGRCAVCGIDPNYDKIILARDHWYPLSRPFCPGTIPSNIVPLCHGDYGCNNQKSNLDPHTWLIKALGPDEGQRVYDEIDRFLETTRRTRYDE
jgi:hypothetical protein